ncbi:hypothetical protein SK3146_05082 [Paenibacillus konkukensis]|uniref:DUF218 domain-containing protein n=1 Tax=Paenibacillus konkukensis TaxID=2020716 RepID=A0ABY4RUS0_9BACL|nr:YdcF family protein [Paenibacillus konkukensis]UQZ85793.1 hypothetical protein SK3146_05082 [Paenibacillus konkukensis]
MLISELHADRLSRDDLTRLLFADSPLKEERGECIFVFGSGGSLAEERVKKAVQLYHAGKASLILFSGGTRWGQRSVPESLIMREQAMQWGVPAEAILVEMESDHTKENVLASMLVLDRKLGLNRIGRLLVVSAPWHMRRCLLTLRTYMPGWIDYALCPDDRSCGQSYNWWLCPGEEKKVYREAEALIHYVREGHIADELF